MGRIAVGQILVAAVVLAAVAGCGVGGLLGGYEGPERLERQARDALARWDAAVAAAGGQQGFVPLPHAMTSTVGQWEESTGDNKLALESGEIVAVVPLTVPPPATAEVHWPDGRRLTVATVTAPQALARIKAQAANSCDGRCTPLEVTGARFTEAYVDTSRGRAIAPAWELTLKGTSVKVTHVAVADSAIVNVTPPPWDPYNSPGGITVERATVSAGDLHMTVTFTGAPGTKDQPCGADYTTTTMESQTALVVIVIADPHPAEGGACTAIGATRTAPVDLTQPLGDRTLLDVVQGLPVAVTTA